MTRFALQPNPDVPPILTVPVRPRRASPTARLVAAGIALACLAVLVTAAVLTPSGGGTGTHRALGLAPCGMLQATGLPCMTCGYTTSFTHFADGNLLASLYIQPGGTLVALAAAATVWVGGYVAATGRPIHRRLAKLPAGWMVAALVGILVLAWGWKIGLVLSGKDGWS